MENAAVSAQVAPCATPMRVTVLVMAEELSSTQAATVTSPPPSTIPPAHADGAVLAPVRTLGSTSAPCWMAAEPPSVTAAVCCVPQSCQADSATEKAYAGELAEALVGARRLQLEPVRGPVRTALT